MVLLWFHLLLFTEKYKSVLLTLSEDVGLPPALLARLLLKKNIELQLIPTSTTHVKEGLSFFYQTYRWKELNIAFCTYNFILLIGMLWHISTVNQSFAIFI